MRSVKFNPVALLRLLDPTRNESVCERAVRVLIAAGEEDENSSGLFSGNSKSLGELSDPEIRAYREGLVEAIVQMDSRDSGSGGGDGEENGAAAPAPPPLLDPASALYLRVSCEYHAAKGSESKSSTSMTMTMPDVPVLGETLRVHLDRLISLIRSDSRAEGDNDNDDHDLMRGLDDDSNSGGGNGYDGDSATDVADDLEESESFVCVQLLKLLSRSSDLSEEGSRRHLVTVCIDLLSSPDTPDDLVEDCVAALAAAHKDGLSELRFLRTVSEIASNVCDDQGEGEEEVGGEGAKGKVGGEDAIALRRIRVLSILSYVLERCSGRVSSDAVVLDSLACHIVPAVTSNDSRIREMGISCLGRYALLAKEQTVEREYAPLLLQVCANEDERMEVRAQAAMALCDLAVIFSSVLSPRQSSHPSDCDEFGKNMNVGGDMPAPFVEILYTMLRRHRSALAVVAAEVTARLHFAGRIHDPILLAHLTVIFFDKDLLLSGSSLVGGVNDDDNDDEDVAEVGSPVRLQQILSLFFPGYALRSRSGEWEGKDSLSLSVAPMLALVDEKMKNAKKGDGGKSLRRAGSASAWPVAKMIEFICSTVDTAQRQQRQVEEELLEKDRTRTAQVSAPNFAENGNNDEKNLTEEDDTDDNVDGSDEGGRPVTATEPSATILASLAIAQFISARALTLTDAFIRTLCKVLGSASVDVSSDYLPALRDLKLAVDNLASIVIDDKSLDSLKDLAETLDEVEDADDKSKGGGETNGEASHVDLLSAMEKATLEDDNEGLNMTTNVPINLLELIEDDVQENRVEVGGDIDINESHGASQRGPLEELEDNDDDDFFDGMYGSDVESASDEGEAYEDKDYSPKKENRPSGGGGETAIPRREMSAHAGPRGGSVSSWQI